MITKLSLSLIGQDHCVISLLINLHFSHWFPISTLHVSRADPKARLHDTEARHYARHARHARQPAWQILEAVGVPLCFLDDKAGVGSGSYETTTRAVAEQQRYTHP